MPTDCVHHWLLGAPVNDFEANTVTIHYRCKKCGREEDRTTDAVDTGNVTEQPAVKDAPEGFHLLPPEVWI